MERVDLRANCGAAESIPFATIVYVGKVVRRLPASAVRLRKRWNLREEIALARPRRAWPPTPAGRHDS